MSRTQTVPFRTPDEIDNLRDNYVNPYHLEDRKRRVSIAKVDAKLYAFDDLCTHDQCPLSAGLLTGTTIMCQCGGRQATPRPARSCAGPRRGRSQPMRHASTAARSRSASDAP